MRIILISLPLLALTACHFQVGGDQKDSASGTAVAETEGAAPLAPRYPANGLPVERVYTTAGVHPYDEVSWQRRDVVMTNWRDGSINFEQRGVEFPEFWPR